MAEASRQRRVLLTGATGFVGRQVHRALVADGHSVRAVIRPGRTDRLAAPADIIEMHDLFAADHSALARFCADVDTLVHAAWFVVPGRYLEAPENLDCLAGSLALARAAVSTGVSHVVGIGTCLEYRLPCERLTASSPLEPTTLYATTKSALHATLDRFLSAEGVGFSWARLFYLYGEGEHESRLVPHVRSQLANGKRAELSAGTQLRDFLDVAKAGRMIARIVKTQQAGAINICSGRAVTLRAFVEDIADETGQRDLLAFGAAPPRATDPEAVVGVCNLAPVTPNKEDER